MKTAEIEVGKAYSNGKGSVRLVTEEGKHLASPWQMDRDCVGYRVVAGRTVGRASRCTRNSFASWARERAPEHDG